MGVLGLYGGPYIKKVRDPNLQRFPEASDILLEIIYYLESALKLI